jgi:hypothetical protein
MNKFMVSSATYQNKLADIAEERMDLAKEDLGKIPGRKVEYWEAFMMLRQKYKTIKRKVSTNIQDNRFYRVLENNIKTFKKNKGMTSGMTGGSGSTLKIAGGNIIRYFTTQIKNMKVTLNMAHTIANQDPAKDKEDFNGNYWLNPSFRNYIILLDNLLVESFEIREVLFSETVGEHKQLLTLKPSLDPKEKIPILT